MAARFEYDPAQELLLITFEADLGDAELFQAYQTARRCAESRTVRYGLLDGLKLTGFSVSPDRVKGMAHLPPMLPQESNRCIVVDQDFLFGMARMYQMLGGDSRERLRICRSLPEAYEYLGIQVPASLEAIENS